MTMMAKMASDGLTAEQRAEIYRRQMLVERDRLEVMHANLHIVPSDDHEDADKALTLRLGASEMAAQDGIAKGRVEDFLVARIDPDHDDEPIVIMAWSDLAASIQQDGAEAAAVARLADLGIEQSALREAMARKVVNQARIRAIQEFRGALADPAAAYAPVPIAGYHQNIPPPIASPNGEQPIAAGPYAAMTPTEAAQKFFEHNPRTGGKDGTSRKKGGAPWTQKTRDQFELPALLLEQVIDGRPLATVIHDDLVELNDCFEKLHGPSFRKSPKHRAMTIREIVEETKERVREGEQAAKEEAKRKRTAIPIPANQPHRITQDDLGLGITTTNRHWIFLRQLTNWFAKHHPIAELDYSAFIVDDKRNPRELRRAYTADQGRTLFSLAPWTGAKSLQQRMMPGDLIAHDSWYFVPMIAWYTGMRRDEICGMGLADIENADGLWLFNVRDNESRRIKTTSSERKLPFAEELVRLGLPNYVEALRDAGETLLFPELASESGKGTMGDAYYKRVWSKMAKSLPFLGGGQGIHAFRHTAIDSLKGAKISEAVAADFAGHALNGETAGRYSKAHIALLKEAVDAIPKVTKFLDPFPTTLLPARLRAPRAARIKR